jgi:uncharacterized protein YbjQ (UPF0145 family)
LVTIITGIPHHAFEVIRPVMAVGTDPHAAAKQAGAQLAGRLLGIPTSNTSDADAIFASAVHGLESAGTAAGANAVIGVHFVPQIVVLQGVQTYQMLAFGTAVRVHPVSASTKNTLEIRDLPLTESMAPAFTPLVAIADARRPEAAQPNPPITPGYSPPPTASHTTSGQAEHGIGGATDRMVHVATTTNKAGHGTENLFEKLVLALTVLGIALALLKVVMGV